MKLFYRTWGQGQPIIILHGLMGSSDNWLTQAKMLSDEYKVYAIDQRNHGQSPHDEVMNYKAMANDLAEFIEQQGIENPIIIGHSMGGKASMNFAVDHEDKLKALIVVDIAPKAYPVHHDKIVDGLKAIPIETLESRNDADRILSEFVPEPDVRQFLLKNLSRKAEGGFTWKLNLPVIDEHLAEIVAKAPESGVFDKPCMFIRGVRSHYIKDEDRQTIKEMFPQSVMVTMSTGHWVQAEQPKEFVEVVRNFISALDK